MSAKFFGRRGRVGVFFIVTILCAGCAPSGGRTAAGDLAKAGQTLAGAAQGNLAALRDDLDLHVQLLYLESGLTPRNPPSDEQVNAIRGIQESLVLRERAFVELRRAYATFAQLAGDPSAAGVEPHFNDLTDAVNAFGQTVGSDRAAIGHVTGGFLGRGAGLIAGAAQDRMLAGASAVLRTRLEKFADDLRRQQFAFNSIRKTLDETNARVLKEILQSGVDRNPQTLATLMGSLNVNLTDSETAKLIQVGGDRLTDRLRGIAALQRGTQFRRQLQVLDLTVSGIDQLIQQHANFEKEKPLDLASISARVTIIESIVNDYETWRRQDKADAFAGRTPKKDVEAQAVDAE